MSKAKFEAARELIREKKYSEARALLKSIDHPQAAEWLARLDKLDPPIPVFPTDDLKKPAQHPRRRWLIPAIVALLVVCGIVYIIGSNPQIRAEVAANQTGTAVAQAATGTAIMLSATTTFTPSVTPTPQPSATITDTPIPSATPTASITPTPTKPPTNTPSPAPMIYTDSAARVIGPVAIPAGTYRAKVTTSGYVVVEVNPSSGKCGEGTGFLSSLLFDLMQGQATQGAEAILTSEDCTALISVSNVQSQWTLTITKVG